MEISPQTKFVRKVIAVATVLFILFLFYKVLVFLAWTFFVLLVIFVTTVVASKYFPSVRNVPGVTWALEVWGKRVKSS